MEIIYNKKDLRNEIVNVFSWMGLFSLADDDFFHTGKCSKACLKIYQPVCGSDGVTSAMRSGCSNLQE